MDNAMNGCAKERAVRFHQIGQIIDRFEAMGNHLPSQRFDFFIDLDVSRVNTRALLEADDETFLHDVWGIYNNLERNGECPEKSVLKMFEPRVGLV